MVGNVINLVPALTARRIAASPSAYFEDRASELLNLTLLLRITGHGELAARVERLANRAIRLRRRLEADALQTYAAESLTLANELERLVADSNEGESDPS